jgi:hypothetical protein
MKVMYIVLKQAHLIQSKLYSFWTGSNSPVVRAALKSGVRRDETVTRRPASTARIFLFKLFPAARTGWRRGSDSATYLRCIREWRTDVFECQVSLARFLLQELFWRLATKLYHRKIKDVDAPDGENRWAARKQRPEEKDRTELKQIRTEQNRTEQAKGER